MIDIGDLSFQVLLAARRVFEANELRVHEGGDDMALAVSALARAAFAIGKAGDPKLQLIAAHTSVGSHEVTVDIVSDGERMEAP